MYRSTLLLWITKFDTFDLYSAVELKLEYLWLIEGKTRRGNVTDAILLVVTIYFSLITKAPLYSFEFQMEINLFALKVNTRDELHISLHTYTTI